MGFARPHFFDPTAKLKCIVSQHDTWEGFGKPEAISNVVSSRPRPFAASGAILFCLVSTGACLAASSIRPHHILAGLALHSLPTAPAPGLQPKSTDVYPLESSRDWKFWAKRGCGRRAGCTTRTLAFSSSPAGASCGLTRRRWKGRSRMNLDGKAFTQGRPRPHVKWQDPLWAALASWKLKGLH